MGKNRAKTLPSWGIPAAYGKGQTENKNQGNYDCTEVCANAYRQTILPPTPDLFKLYPSHWPLTLLAARRADDLVYIRGLRTTAHGRFYSTACFGTACQLGTILTFLNGWGRKNQKRTYEIQISLFIVLLEHSHAPSFKYYLWLFSCYNGRIEWLWQRPYGSQNQRHFLCGLLKKFCWPLA